MAQPQRGPYVLFKRVAGAAAGLILLGAGVAGILSYVRPRTVVEQVQVQAPPPARVKTSTMRQRVTPRPHPPQARVAAAASSPGRMANRPQPSLQAVASFQQPSAPTQALSTPATASSNTQQPPSTSTPTPPTTSANVVVVNNSNSQTARSGDATGTGAKSGDVSNQNQPTTVIVISN